MKLISARDAISLLKCSKSSLSRLCKLHDIGRMLGNQRVFTPRELDRLGRIFTGKIGWPKGRKRK